MVVLGGLLLRMGGDPAPGDPVDRSAKNHIRDKCQAEYDHDELQWLDRFEHDHLVQQFITTPSAMTRSMW